MKKYTMVSLNILCNEEDAPWMENQLGSCDVANLGLMSFGASSREATPQEIREMNSETDGAFDDDEDKRLSGGIMTERNRE